MHSSSYIVQITDLTFLFNSEGEITHDVLCALSIPSATQADLLATQHKGTAFLRVLTLEPLYRVVRPCVCPIGALCACDRTEVVDIRWS
jgi:hypothetical protein